ncbi:unnamed protein product [Peronospora farinosa]|uniref:Uncharacterized protein n=1 Tax=Peronospora farinosa TaxID=134698 RepID=A0ABN8BVS7_9STRA|nr:unnamed protein product [Peronospora farinosa]
MCTTCAGKRQVPQQTKRPESWPREGRDPDREHVRKPHQREEKVCNQPRSSGRATRVEHMEPEEKARHQRRIQNLSQNAQGQRLTIRELPSKRCDSRKDTHEPLTRDDRRRRSTQTTESQQEAARRCSLQQQNTIYRVSKESVMPNRSVSTNKIETQPYWTSAGTSSRKSNSSGGQSEPRRSEEKSQRLSTTADILGMSRALELPPNYFDMSSSSQTFSAMRSPEQDALDCRQKLRSSTEQDALDCRQKPSSSTEQDALDCRQKPSSSTETRQSRRRTTTALPQLELQKQDETEEERERRRSASYARMLLRMQRHYDAVQVNGNQACPTTAPPRRIRTKRQGKSAVVRDVKDDPTKFAIDLDYLSAYKDAR